jgi:hypothetical protein
MWIFNVLFVVGLLLLAVLKKDYERLKAEADKLLGQ